MLVETSELGGEWRLLPGTAAPRHLRGRERGCFERPGSGESSVWELTTPSSGSGGLREKTSLRLSWGDVVC